jgi:hypothetical protein
MSQSQPAINEDFKATYTAANKSKDSTPYDYNLLASVREELNDTDPAYLEPFSYAIIVRTRLGGRYFLEADQSTERDAVCSTSG